MKIKVYMNITMQTDYKLHIEYSRGDYCKRSLSEEFVHKSHSLLMNWTNY